MKSEDNKWLIPLNKENLPAMYDVPEKDRYYYPNFEDFEYTVEYDNAKQSKAKRLFLQFIRFIKQVYLFFVILFDKRFGFYRYIKETVCSTFMFLVDDFRARKPFLKSQIFISKVIASIGGVAIYSLFCAMIAAKNESSGEYMKTFFVTLFLCSVFIVFANYMNPLHTAPALYSLLTCLLIITGVLLQVMVQKSVKYNGVAGIITNMCIGLGLGLIACFIVVILCRTDYQKYARYLIAFVTIIFAAILIVIRFFSKDGGTNDASNWVDVLGKSLQLSEIIKFLAIIQMSMTFSRKDIDDKKKMLHNILYLGFLAVCFVVCNELGTLLILGFAFLILSFLNIKSMGLFIKICVFGCVVLLIAAGCGEVAYEKVYDVTAPTGEIINALEKQYSEEEQKNITYTQKNTSTVETDFKATVSELYHAITFTFTGESANEIKALTKTAVEFFKSDAIDEEECGILESVVLEPTTNDDGSQSLVVKYKFRKNIESVGLVTKLGAKVYKKALDRLGIEGNQDHANQIKAAMHSTQWFGSEEKNILYVTHMNSDTIFSYALMQLGAGTVILILLVYMLMFFAVLICAFKLKDSISSPIIIGFSICISIQSVIQLGIALRLIPIIGMVSAFLSSGGTANLVNYAMTFFILYSMRLILPSKKGEASEEGTQ